MKKFIYICVIASIFFLGIKNNVIAQPKFTINAFGGYTLPLQDFSSAIALTDTVDDNWPYKNKSGFNFGVDGKLAVGKKGNFRVVFAAVYNMFKQTGNIVNPDGGPQISLTTKMNILAVSLGGEYAFQPTKKFNPFVGLDITTSFFSGSFAASPSVPAFTRTDAKSETRIGLQVGAGIDFMLSKQVGIIVGAKYHFVNLIGKGSDQPGEVAANEIDLGDASHTNESGQSIAARNIGYFQTYAGLSLYFGAPKKTK